MCGLVGIVGINNAPVSRQALERMTAALVHRGPDEEGQFIAGSVGFGFRRLSILDLSPTGHQPMMAEDAKVTIVFNGEIYNYLELRGDLEKRGHRFRSTGDTEVLLRAYCEWGTACLERLNGMWAFLIFDQRRGVVFGSRDRFGIKPLFMHRTRDHLLFASEIKAIKVSGVYDPQPNISTVSRFLLRDVLDDTEQTFYSGIEQVGAGVAFELELSGRMRTWRYWSLDTVPNSSVADPAGAFADLFEDSVRLHMRSDVPVAVNLSGGLDSTSIICASARVRKAAGADGALLAFSFMSDEFDERPYIGDTIAQSGAQLVPLETDAHSLWRDLHDALWYQDEPFHTLNAVIGFQLMRLAKTHGIRVVLNGQGADETIAGYGIYFHYYWHSLLCDGRLRDAWREIREHSRAHGGRNASAVFLRQIQSSVRAQIAGTSWYRWMAERSRSEPFDRDSWYAPELYQAYADARREHAGGDLDSKLKASVIHEPLPLYLRVEDRNSMAHSVEARLPFLDYRLVSLIMNLSPEWKLRGPWNKFVLREAMRDRIPESVRTRVDKMGFPVPVSTWLRTWLFDAVADVLHSQEARERGLYNIGTIQHDLERYRRGEIDITERLFRAFETELWFQMSSGGRTGSAPVDAAGRRYVSEPSYRMAAPDSTANA